MSNIRHGLKSQVHRWLVARLVFGAAAIALLLSLVTYATRYDDIGEAAIVHATNGVEELKLRVERILDETGLDLEQAVQQALDEGPGYRMVSPHGDFVFTRFYTRDSKILGREVTADAPSGQQLEAYLEQASLQFPDLLAPRHEAVTIDGRAYIHVSMAIADQNGGVGAWGEGLFALSEAAVTGARQAALRTAGYVLLIVLIAGLLMYPVVLTLVERLAGFTERLLDANLDTIQVLGNAIAKRDSDTDAHNYRVTLYTIHLARAAGLGTREIRGIIKGAFLHDVGKIGISDNILHKPGRLDDAEFAVMKTHVDKGLEILERSEWLEDAAGVVGSHHEKFDGSGYPQRKKGDEIPLGARIFALADVFDALTSKRPYKEPFTFEESMRILEEGRSSHFDPAMLDLFAKHARDFYRRYSGREDEGLRDELARVIETYFTDEYDSLVN